MNYRRLVCLAKARRVLGSIPSADLLATLTVIVGTITIGASIVGGNLKDGTLPYLWASGIVAAVLGIVLLIILCMKTWLEYNRRKSDPSLVLQFQEDFNDLAPKCEKAATVCKAFLERWEEQGQDKQWATVDARYRHPNEDILDFFEDLGFYLNGDQFSDVVAHHHFFHWIRGWFSVLEPFIKYYREKNNAENDAAYMNVEILHGRTSEIERRYRNPKFILKTKEEKMEFLTEEGAIAPQEPFATYLERLSRKPTEKAASKDAGGV